jgi:biotin transporter BioY
VFTPLDFRHYLAAFPAIAILAGCGAARWWTKGPFLQAAAIVLIGSSVLIGVRHWLAALR